MFDIGFSELMVIGLVALIVIGPERLPRVARTIGHLTGRLQRYVADVKADINREVELDELRKMKDSVESAARDVEQSIHSGARDIENEFKDIGTSEVSQVTALETPGNFPEYKHPRKNWRLKQGATPQWYKARNGVRGKALSGAARVARFRPQKLN